MKSRITHRIASHRIASRYNRVSERFLIMLALLAAFFLSLSGVRAQSNTEYSFRQQAVADGQGFNSNGDPVPVLTMDCLAANGYGQWTLSSQPGQGGDGSGATTYPAGWYLLANGLYAPSTHFNASDVTHFPACIPPGVVQNGTLGLTYTPTDPKAAANLEGGVFFVWPDPNVGAGGTTREDFVVQGFRTANVDLSLSFLSSPTPPMNVVTSPTPIPFPAISTTTGTGTHDVVSTTPYQDEFHVAYDAEFIYITWCSTKHMTPPITTSEIWVEVIDINTFVVMLGPVSVGAGERPTIACDPRNNQSATPSPRFELTFIAPPFIGVAPFTGGSLIWESYNGAFSPHPITNNILNPAGGANFTYDFIAHARALVSSVAGGAWHPAVYAIADSKLGDIYSPALILYNQDDPNIPVGTASYVDGMVMGTPGLPIPTPPAPQVGWPVKDGPIVAIANPYDNQIISTNTPSDWQGYDQFHCVYQLDISQNPGQPANQMYPLLIVRNSDNSEANPLQPNPGGSTSDTRLVLNQLYPIPPSPNPPQLIKDPATYCAAVNQMGIHVHWRTSEGVHYYTRDTGRSFDEPIDENTIVTDICTVRDGAAHGGMAGATILQNKTMAIWTDLNYGFSLTDPNYGLYQPRIPSSNVDSHVGMLNFRDENVMLDVGGTTPLTRSNLPANLTDVPYFYFNFLGENRGSTQEVVVHGTWNYYGLVDVHDPTTLVPTVIGSSFTDGNLIGDWGNTAPCDAGAGTIQIATYTDANSVDHPGTLFVHSGAHFFCGEHTGFSITPDANNLSGNIDVLYGGDVFPISNTTYQITDTTGTMTLDGQTLLERAAEITFADTGTWMNAGGCLRGHIPDLYTSATDVTGPHPEYQADDVILRIGEAWDKTEHTTGIQFDAENFDYFNTNYSGFPGGKSEIRIGDYDAGYNVDDIANGGDITFNYGYADAVEIHMIDPDAVVGGGGCGNPLTITPVDYTIENMTFNDLRGYIILLECDQPSNSNDEYGHVSILNNSFGYFAGNVGLPEWFGGEDYDVYPIYARNFNSEGYGFGELGPIDINGNQFIGSNCNAAVDDNDGGKMSAISLENTTANVESNNILDDGYTNGIYASAASNPSMVVNSYSLLCSNDIENLKFGSCAPSTNTTWCSGIKSAYERGYVKLNTITNDNIGYSSISHDKPYLIFNTIHDNNLFQIDAASNSTIDMTGVHGGGNDYAANNTVYGPSSDINTNIYPWVIKINDGTSDVFVGKLSTDYSNWGQNNLYSTSTGTYRTIIGSIASIDLGNVDYNFWGYYVGTAYFDPFLWSSGYSDDYWSTSLDNGPISAQAYGTNTLSYTATSSLALTGPSSFSGITCGTGWGGEGTTKSSKNTTLSVLNDSSTACTQLYFSGYFASGNREWQQAFDSLTYFIETCPNNPHAPSAFSDITTAVAGLYGPYGGSYRATYFAWLESVLYLNTTNPEYFCACVEELANTVAFPFDTALGWYSRRYNDGLAVYRWLILNTTCDTPSLAQMYDQSRQDQFEQWANDQDHPYKLDTTLPPLSTWGLDTLLARHFLYADVSERNGPDIISNAAASPNPVSTGTIISFGISKEAYVKIEVFDILGNRVSSAGFESLFEPGNKAVPISLQGLPAGTYFARIVTAYGEVQTVKLVKE